MPIPLKDLTLYVFLYVVLVDCLIALVVAYEIFLNTGDSWAQTAVNIAQGIGASVAVTIVVFANVEVLKLLAKMYDRRRFNEGMEQGLEQGMEQGLEQGMEQGLEQGMEKGLEQGMEQGLKQGMEQGMERGLEQGIEQGRQERDKRLKEAYERFGVDLDGVRVLPRTPEIQEFLEGKNGQVS